MIVACTRLLRGAGYVAFNGELPAQAQHSALASEYAHVTAPLRRLADRYAGEVCVALCAGTEVPSWVIEGMGGLPETMTESGRRANRYENAVVNLCEAELLHDRVGERFTAVVVDLDEKSKQKGGGRRHPVHPEVRAVRVRRLGVHHPGVGPARWPPPSAARRRPARSPPARG